MPQGQFMYILIRHLLSGVHRFLKTSFYNTLFEQLFGSYLMTDELGFMNKSTRTIDDVFYWDAGVMNKTLLLGFPEMVHIVFLRRRLLWGLFTSVDLARNPFVHVGRFRRLLDVVYHLDFEQNEIHRSGVGEVILGPSISSLLCDSIWTLLLEDLGSRIMIGFLFGLYCLGNMNLCLWVLHLLYFLFWIGFLWLRNGLVFLNIYINRIGDDGCARCTSILAELFCFSKALRNDFWDIYIFICQFFRVQIIYLFYFLLELIYLFLNVAWIIGLVLIFVASLKLFLAVNFLSHSMILVNFLTVRLRFVIIVLLKSTSTGAILPIIIS